MKRKTFIIITLMMIVFMVMFFHQNTYSVVDTNININNKSMNQFDDLGSTIISTVRILGMIISVGALMIMGIRYMISSTEEKAMQKESMIFYCIGAILLFAIVTIVSAVYNWTSGIEV